MSNWRSLESVPKDGTDVLFWVPDVQARVFDKGEVVVGWYDAALDQYFDITGDLSEPICWAPVPPGPRSMEDIQWKRS